MADFQEAWAKFRRLRTTFAVLLLCEFFLNDLAAFAFRSILHISYPGNFYFGVYAITPVGLFLVGNSLKSWKCPRCGKAFAGGFRVWDKVSTSLDWWLLPQKCFFCELPKFSNDPTR